MPELRDGSSKITVSPEKGGKSGFKELPKVKVLARPLKSTPSPKNWLSTIAKSGGKVSKSITTACAAPPAPRARNAAPVIAIDKLFIVLIDCTPVNAIKCCSWEYS
jgi:hypothetical protein